MIANLYVFGFCCNILQIDTIDEKLIDFAPYNRFASIRYQQNTKNKRYILLALFSGANFYCTSKFMNSRLFGNKARCIKYGTCTI